MTMFFIGFGSAVITYFASVAILVWLCPSATDFAEDCETLP